MHTRDMPKRLATLIQSQLPPEPLPGPTGGRPFIPHQTVLQVIWFVCKTGIAYRDVPSAVGCSGETARTRIRDWQQAGCWDSVHHLVLAELNANDQLDLDTQVVDSVLVRAHGGGDLTGPNPTDRARPGTKFTVNVDGNGTPLSIRVRGANRSDQHELLPTLVAFEGVGGKVGRPQSKPKRAVADAGYDSEVNRSLLRWLGIEPLIRKKGAPHGSGLGKVRWVVERTISWLKGCRRVRFRYDRSEVMITAMAKLAMIFVCFEELQPNAA